MRLCAALVILPLLLVGAVLKLVLFVFLLPFKILKAGLAVIGGIFFGAGKVVLGLGLLVAGVVLAGGLLLAAPFVVLALAAGAVWLLIRLLRPRSQPDMARAVPH